MKNKKNILILLIVAIILIAMAFTFSACKDNKVIIEKKITNITVTGINENL